MLAECGDRDKLRARADAGDGVAALRLAELLAERGDFDGAAHILRPRADCGDVSAAVRLAHLLAERGDLDGAEQVLRPRVGAGDSDVASRPVDVLARRGDLNGLRALADAGDGDANRLADVLTKQGRAEEAERLRRFGLKPDGSIASE